MSASYPGSLLGGLMLEAKRNEPFWVACRSGKWTEINKAMDDLQTQCGIPVVNFVNINKDEKDIDGGLQTRYRTKTTNPDCGVKKPLPSLNHNLS